MSEELSKWRDIQHGDRDTDPKDTDLKDDVASRPAFFNRICDDPAGRAGRCGSAGLAVG